MINLFQFCRADFRFDDGMLFRLDNRVTDAIHDVFSTVFGRSQGVESRPFPLEGVSEAFVYAVHFFTEVFYFIKKIKQV